MGKAIDHIDRAIIACLQQDGRRSSAEIARHLGVAERTVRARLDRLIHEGIIKLVAVLNPVALGYTVSADVFLEVELGRIEEVASHIARFEEVAYVGLSTGERDVSVQIRAPSVESAYDFVTHTLSRVPGVERAKLFVTPRVLKSASDWSLPEQSAFGSSLSTASNALPSQP